MRRIFGISLPALLLSTSAWGQLIGSGSIDGTVRDQYGEGLPGVSIMLKNETIGAYRAIKTSDDGAFQAQELPPAVYSLQITRKSYIARELKDIRVTVGQRLHLNINLEPEKPSKDYDPTPVILPLVTDDTPGVTDVVTQEQLDSLPLSRDWAYVSLLTPGVVLGPSGRPAIRGAAEGNAVYFDGLDITNRFGKGTLTRPAGQDAVQEVQVFAGVPTAQTGGYFGGALNVVTRGGSNDLHGNLYEYYRKPSLAASDPYALGRDLREKRHLAGGTVSAPLMKDHIFSIFNFEALRSKNQTLNRIVNPTFTDPLGISVLPSACTATAAQCSAATAFLKKQMNATVPRDADGLNAFAKLDLRAEENNSFHFALGGTSFQSDMGAYPGRVSMDGSMLGNNGNLSEQSRFGKASWVRAFMGNALNEARLGVTHDRVSTLPDTAFWPSTGKTGITIAGANVGASSFFPAANSEQRYEFAENLTAQYANHTAKFGFEILRTADRVQQLSNAWGSYEYPTLTAFAEDFTGNTTGKRYSYFRQSYGDPNRHWKGSDFAIYAQDTWRVFPRLTVDLGLRWERPMPPRPRWINSDYWQTATIPRPGLNFAPRLGLAYLAGQSTTFRFGWGYFYAPFSEELLGLLMRGAQSSILVAPSNSRAPVFRNIVRFDQNDKDYDEFPKGSESLTFARGKLKNPHSNQITFSIEQRLGNAAVFTASYLHLKGVRLYSTDDLNLNAPTKTATYTIQNASGVKTGEYTTSIWTAKSDTRYAHLWEVANDASSSYNALALQFRLRPRHGLSAQASYTWSKAMDNVGAGGFASAYTYDANYNEDKGLSSTDQRHRLALNWTWAPKTSVARPVLNGWEISGIVTVASGRPLTPMVLVLGQQFSSITPIYTNSLNGSGGWSRAPFLPVGSLLTDKQQTLDARISRTFSFAERVRVTLLVEAFNALNAQFNTNLNTLAYIASGGVLKPAAGYGEGNSAASAPDGTNARRMQLALRLSF